MNVPSTIKIYLFIILFIRKRGWGGKRKWFLNSIKEASSQVLGRKAERNVGKY